MAHRGETPDVRAQRAVLQKLESLYRAGLTHLGRPPRLQQAASSPPESTAAATSAPGATHSATPADSPGRPTSNVSGTVRPTAKSLFTDENMELFAPALSPQERGTALEALRREVADCTRCPELAATRTQMDLLQLARRFPSRGVGK